jgi:hypothetical protein
MNLQGPRAVLAGNCVGERSRLINWLGLLSELCCKHATQLENNLPEVGLHVFVTDRQRAHQAAWRIGHDRAMIGRHTVGRFTELSQGSWLAYTLIHTRSPLILLRQ